MTDLKQWIDNRGLKGEEYLGNLCKNNHEYLDTGKSIRCKPTNRPNGKCLCCRKIQSDNGYKKNPEVVKARTVIWQKNNPEKASKFKTNWKRKKRRRDGCELRENITLWTAIKNAGAPTVVDLIQKQIKENKVFDQKKHQKIKYRTNLEFNISAKLKRGMQRAKERGLPYEKIDVKKIINKIYLHKQCCAYCGKRLNLLIANQDNSLEMDHIVSFSNKGSHTFDNLIPSCKKCNDSKKANKLEDWYKKQLFFKKEILEKIKQ